ncbi:MAG: FAD-dependent thymidylate synthase [Nitrososphaeria archaeon]
MEVKVLSYTQNPEVTCAVAMRSTRTREPAHELVKREWHTKCDVPNFSYGNRCRGQESNVQCPHFSFCAVRFLKNAKKMNHWGVFEHATFTVSVSGVSRALTHQLVRHRLASYSQQSQRQVKIDTSSEWYIKPPSIGDCELFETLMNEIAKCYLRLVEDGIPEEDARYVLPNACKTNIVITANARQWLHILGLRMDEQSQWEIRKMSRMILEELSKISPLIFEDIA